MGDSTSRTTKVYHLKAEARDAETVRFPFDYQLAAKVQTEDPERAFDLTNSGEQHPWWQNEGVQRFGPTTRSTAVDDIVELPSGKLYKCEIRGFTPLAVEDFREPRFEMHYGRFRVEPVVLRPRSGEREARFEVVIRFESKGRSTMLYCNEERMHDISGILVRSLRSSEYYNAADVKSIQAMSRELPELIAFQKAGGRAEDWCHEKGLAISEPRSRSSPERSR